MKNQKGYGKTRRINETNTRIKELNSIKPDISLIKDPKNTNINN